VIGQYACVSSAARWVRSRTVLVAIATAVLATATVTWTVWTEAEHHSAPSMPPTATQGAVPNREMFAGPSVDDQFVCSRKAASAIAITSGLRTVELVKPIWSNGTYSCRYSLADRATVAVAVTDFRTEREAMSYFEMRSLRLGKTDTEPDCSGDCATVATRSGHALFRYGDEVLVVDASRLPASFLGTNRQSNARNLLAAVSPP